MIGHLQSADIIDIHAARLIASEAVDAKIIKLWVSNVARLEFITTILADEIAGARD
jgi:hypothetical protein